MTSVRLLAVGVVLSTASCVGSPRASASPPSTVGTIAARPPQSLSAVRTLSGVADSCKIPGDIDAKYRWMVKHRSPVAASPKSIDVPAFLVLDDPADVATSATRDRDDLQHLLDPHEGEVREFEGDVWVAKIEDNDCDFHLELSKPGGTAQDARVIAEVSQGAEFTKARSSIATMLGIGDIKLQCYKFTEPARVKLTGFLFYDGHHWSSKHPKVGWLHGSKQVGTLWELHPVWRVEVLSNGKTQGC